jgi:hypothetical protein
LLRAPPAAARMVNHPIGSKMSDSRRVIVISD